MKKLLALVAIAILTIGISNTAKADVRFGIKGGLNYTSMGDIDVSNIGATLKGYAGFNVGLALNIGKESGFAVQPELVYSAKGSKIQLPSAIGLILGSESVDLKVDYLELPVNIQYGIKLPLIRIFGQVTPYAGYTIGQKLSLGELGGEFTSENMKKLQYGVGVGAGIEVLSFQLSVRYLWNLGPIASFPDAFNQVTSLDDSKFRGLEIALAILF